MAVGTRKLRNFRRAAWLTVPLIFGAVLVLPRFLASGTRLASAAWQEEHSQRLRDPLLTRCHVFTGADAHLRARNLVAWHGGVTAAMADQGRVPKLVAGREEGLRAVRLEDIPMESLPASVHRQLTVEFRIRHHGQGFVLGGNSRHSGTLAAM